MLAYPKYCILGTISANAEDSKSGIGGASGGSILLMTHKLFGSGSIQVNGGAGRFDVCLRVKI